MRVKIINYLMYKLKIKKKDTYFNGSNFGSSRIQYKILYNPSVVLCVIIFDWATTREVYITKSTISLAPNSPPLPSPPIRSFSFLNFSLISHCFFYRSFSHIDEPIATIIRDLYRIRSFVIP